MRDISTRGEAPRPGFREVMLPGLARDGGLYVPETWPQLDAGDDRGVFRPAVRRSRRRRDPALHRRLNLRSRSRPHGERSLWHVPPSRRRAADRSSSPNTIHPGAVPRPDAGLQGRGDAAAGAADGPCAGPRRAHAPSWSRPRAIPAAPRSTPFAAAARSIVVVLFPHGRISDVQRRMMTTARHANVRAGGIEGTFDDCQAIVKGLFNHHAFRDRCACRASTPSTGRGSSRRWSIISLPRWRWARRTEGRLHGADRQFRRLYRRLCCRSVSGCRSTG